MKKLIKLFLSVVLCMTLVIVSAYTSFNVKTLAASTQVEIKNLFNEYVKLNGNNVHPDTMLSYINKAIAPYTVTLETSDDYFIYHSVDGVYDEGDKTYPIEVAGYNGYMSVILEVSKDGTSLGKVGCVETIPFTTENLGVLTSDVYSADNTNFVTDESGNIVGYNGTAEKIVIPANFVGQINLKDCAGKNNVKAVYIGGKTANMESTTIANRSFNNWANLRAMVFPQYIGTIDDWAVSQNPNLKYIKLPYWVKPVFGKIGAAAFALNPQLSTAHHNQTPSIPVGGYYGSVFQGTAIRDYYLPAHNSGYKLYYGSSNASNFGNSPTYTEGTQVLLTAAEDSTATLARAAVLAKKAVDDLLADSYIADSVKATMDAAYSSKNALITSFWNVPFQNNYGVLTLTDGNDSIDVEINKDKIDAALENEVEKAFSDYVALKGNNVEPEKMVEYVSSRIGSKYIVEVVDTFIYHAVDGVLDGDDIYPINIPGHKGYMSAVLRISNRSIELGTVGVIADIDFNTENLGVLTTDVYSSSNENFITQDGVITSYTGTAEKIVIPDSFNGTISLNESTGKEGVKAVYISGYDADKRSLLKIDSSSFREWPNLRAVVLPRRMSEIGNLAFYGCKQLKYVVLPAAVVVTGYGAIKNDAFNGCTSLENICYRPTLPSADIWKNVFTNTAIRDYYLASDSRFVQTNGSYVGVCGSKPSYTEGTTVVLTAPEQATATFARAAVLAQIAAEGKSVTPENAESIKAEIVSAYSSKINGITAEWADTYFSALVLNFEGKTISVKCNEIDTNVSLSLELKEGADYYYNDIAGMSFTAEIYGFNETTTNKYVSCLDFGMLICPTDYVLNIDFTKESLSENNKEFLDISAKSIISSDTSNSFIGVISNINPENYNRLFSARAYADITFVDGTYKRIYSEYDREINSERLANIAKNELSQNSSLTEEQKAYFNSVISSINVDKPAVIDAAANWINPQRGGSELQAEQLKNSIITAENSTPDSSVYTGTTYYVSPDGSDSNDGKSASKPWKTFKNLVTKKYSFSKGLKAGDKVLFKRGGIYRGASALVSGVYYGAYGEGDKPAIYGSLANLAKKTWKNSSTNIWTISGVSESKEDSVGIVVFNHGEEVGVMKTELSSVEKQGDYYYDRATDVLYVYSNQNPSEKYFSIEIGVSKTLFVVNGTAKNITIDNLTLKYTGLYAVSVGDGAENIHVKNCEIGYIGGSYKVSEYDGVRYGNGVEFWNSCTNVSVENCWIYQIYDSGLSHQGRITSDRKVFTAQGVTFKGNLVEYTSYGSIEYWASDGSDVNGNVNMMKDILYENNILRFAGYGWAEYSRPDSKGWHIFSGNYTNATDNFVIKNNVFDIAKGGLVLCVTSHPSIKSPTLIGNTYIQYNGEKLGKYGYSNGLEMLYFDDAVAQNITNKFKDTAASITVYK